MKLPNPRSLILWFGSFLFILAVEFIAVGSLSAKKWPTLPVGAAPVTAANVISPVATPVLDLSSGSVQIPAIKVDAPITWNIPLAQTEDYLPKGAVHEEGSALPGQNGNLVLTGHSSDYPWKKDPYGSLFSKVDALKIGDDITVTTKNASFTYKVSGTEVVTPDDGAVLNATPNPTLTLITCYPLYTTWKRYIVHATLVTP